MKKTLLKNSEVIIELEDGILIATWERPTVDLILAQRGVKFRLEATDYKSYPVLINIKKIKKISKPARDFLATPAGAEGIISAALLIDSPISSVIGNFFLKISKPVKPAKIFSDELKAKKWLAKFVIK